MRNTQTLLLTKRLQSLKIAVSTICIGMLAMVDSHAGSATWKSNPVDSNWNNAGNWTPATVPNGSADTATFGASTITGISMSATTEVDDIVFKPGASPYTIGTGPSVSLTIRGDITNNSGVVQNLGNSVAPYSPIFFYGAADELVNAIGVLYFNADIGTGTFTIPADIAISYFFFAPAGAGFGTFDVFGTLDFNYTSTADHGTFVVHRGENGAFGGNLAFSVGGNAADATITLEGASSTDPGTEGRLGFGDGTTAGNATIIANGGTNGGAGAFISFNSHASGDTANITLLGNSQLDVSQHLSSATRVLGSIAGSGAVFLGDLDLSIGLNSTSTVFSGTIQDGGINGASGGSVTKVGSGALTLTGANTYTGGTHVTRGMLLVDNRTGSGTGSGAVDVEAGILGGRGVIAGPVTIGDSHGSTATLAPGAGTTKSNRLTIQSAITFQSDGTYTCKVNSKNGRADQVSANGVTINTGAQFNLTVTGNKVLPLGTIFTVISNTSAAPLAGTFSNLADGSTLTIGSNAFQASYEGGDGNDLTLTVVP